MALLNRFQDNEYVNWIKAGQALLCTAEGIYAFCEGPIKAYHLVLHQKFPRLPCRGTCMSTGLCTDCAKRRQDWKTDILSQLTLHTSPCWKNTDKSRWESDAWEIAKIFMRSGQGAFRTGASVTDPIGLLQLVLNCQLFTSCISNRQSFEDVKEIRNKMFHSADFKLTNTELKDYIKTMTSLLEDPTELKNDAHATQAVLQLQQIEALPLETNDIRVLQSERTMWKMKIEWISREQIAAHEEVDEMMSFATEVFGTEISALKRRLDTAERRETNLEAVQEQHEHVISQQQEQLMQQLDKISQLQHQRATETLRQRVEGELQNVKEELKKVHKRTVETYLRNKEDHENTTLEQLSDIYIELRVHGTEEEYRRLEKRSTINYLEQEMDMERCRQINAQELFSPDHRNAKTPLKVLVIGKAGIGKTMFTLNVLDVWQKEGQLSSKFDNVNFFSLRDLSHVGKCSLADLLFTHQGIPRPSNDAIFEYLTHMQSTLLIFDALDEFGSYSSASESKAYDHNEEVEISQLIGSIICGKMLKLASLLVTSRPGGVSEHKVFDRIAEIYGFVESRIFEYVSKFCNGNCNLESHIRAYVKHNTNIRSLCYVPMLCNLVCRIAKMNMEHGSKVPLPATVTQLLTTCVVHFAIEHHPNFKGKELAEDDDIIAKIKDPLLNHSTLAKHGMSQQPIQVVFSNDELKECQLSQETATQCGLLTVSRVKAPGQLCRKVKQLFYFFHLIVEEFFASIALISNEQEIKTVMKQTQNEGQLDMVLVFISGLVGDPDNKQFLQSLGHQTTITASDLLRLVINQEREQRRRNHKSGILLLLLLVYESRQSDLWVQIKDFVLKDGKELNLAETHMSPVEQKSLAYVMTKCDDLTILNLDRCNLCGTDLVVGLGDLSQLRELWLGNNRNLHGPEITTALIDSLLKLPQLEILHLSICDLTDEDVTRLASVLPHLGLLKLLGLGGNSITDKGALNVTAAAVKLPHLENFWLQDNWLSETGVKVVRRAFYCARGPGRVAIPGMELQRPPGEVAIHHDPVVYWQRRVANYEMALARLSRQRVEDMASCLETEVIKMLDFIAVSKEQLRLVQNIRDRTSETAEDRRLDDERSNQMRRKFNRMGMGQRPQ